MVKIKSYKFDGIYRINGKFVTQNLTPGYRSVNEELVIIDNKEYRVWDWQTSKPSAAFKKGIKIFPLKKNFKVLYLGLAESKTASFFSDIVGKEGIIYGIEISERSLRDSMQVAEKRGNIVCILNDGRLPEKYENIVIDKVDIAYSDTADPQQVEILIRNCEKFLKPKGYAILAIKSQSISSTAPPKQVYKECLEELGKHFEILDKVELDPYQKNHLFLVMKARF